MANIRVSEWAAGEIRKRAKEEGRTVVSVVDRLLGRTADMDLLSSRPPRVGDRRITADGHEEIYLQGPPKELKYEPET